MLWYPSTIHVYGLYILFDLILYVFNVEIIDLNKKLKSNENWNPNFGPHIKYMYFILKTISFLQIFQNLFLFLSCTTSRTKCPIMSAWGIVEDLDLLDDQQEHASGGYGRLVEWSLTKSKNFVIIQTQKLWNLNILIEVQLHLWWSLDDIFRIMTLAAELF